MNKPCSSTTEDRLIHALGCVRAASGCLQGSTIQNAGIISDYLGEAAVSLTAILKSGMVPVE